MIKKFVFGLKGRKSFAKPTIFSLFFLIILRIYPSFSSIVWGIAISSGWFSTSVSTNFSVFFSSFLLPPVMSPISHRPILRSMPASVVGMPVLLVNHRFRLVMPSSFFHEMVRFTPGIIWVPDVFLRLFLDDEVVVVVVVTVTPFFVVFLVVVFFVAIE